MAALTADSPFKWIGTPTKMSFSCNGADIFYGGALLYADTGGGCQATPAAGDYFLGIVCYQQETTAAAQEVYAYIDGTFLLPVGSGITAADEGDLLLSDTSGTKSDNPADTVANLDVTGAANDIAIGRILRVTTEGMWIRIEPRLCVTNVGWV